MNYSQMSMFLQMRKLRPREGGGLSKGEQDILPGTLDAGFFNELPTQHGLQSASVDLEDKL